jgi:hypothetical protein
MKKSILIFSLFFISIVLSVKLEKIDSFVLNDLSLNNNADILVVLKEQIDVNSLVDENGVSVHKMRNHDKRGYLVMNSLMNVATRSQRSLINFLKTEKVEFQSFWITNIISINSCSKSLMEKISEREDVKKIESNKNVSPVVEVPSKEIIANLTKNEEAEWFYIF